jgi:chaperonin GroES
MSKTKSKIPIQPLADRVVLKEILEKDLKTASGIIIPNSANSDKDTKKGEVLAVGVGRLVDGKLQKPEVTVGDRVLYTWGDEMVVGGQKYIIVGSDNILAILK